MGVSEMAGVELAWVDGELGDPSCLGLPDLARVHDLAHDLLQIGEGLRGGVDAQVVVAGLLGFLEGPRMVLPYRDHDDARPSIIDQHGDRYISVFSGKVDHAPRVADDVASLVMQRFE